MEQKPGCPCSSFQSAVQCVRFLWVILSRDNPVPLLEDLKHNKCLLKSSRHEMDSDMVPSGLVKWSFPDTNACLFREIILVCSYTTMTRSLNTSKTSCLNFQSHSLQGKLLFVHHCIYHKSNNFKKGLAKRIRILVLMLNPVPIMVALFGIYKKSFPSCSSGENFKMDRILNIESLTRAPQ